MSNKFKQLLEEHNFTMSSIPTSQGRKIFLIGSCSENKVEFVIDPNFDTNELIKMINAFLEDLKSSLN